MYFCLCSGSGGFSEALAFQGVQTIWAKSVFDHLLPSGLLVTERAVSLPEGRPSMCSSLLWSLPSQIAVSQRGASLAPTTPCLR